MKRTPGPWTYQGPSPGKSNMDDGGDYAIVAAGYIIGEAVSKVARETFAPAEANARLMAAAPDLLAAIKLIVDAKHNGELQVFYSAWELDIDGEELYRQLEETYRNVAGDG